MFLYGFGDEDFLLAYMKDGTIGAVVPGLEANYYESLALFSDSKSGGYGCDQFLEDLKNGIFKISGDFSFELEGLKIVKFSSELRGPCDNF